MIRMARELLHLDSFPDSFVLYYSRLDKSQLSHQHLLYAFNVESKFYDYKSSIFLAFFINF